MMPKKRLSSFNFLPPEARRGLYPKHTGGLAQGSESKTFWSEILIPTTVIIKPPKYPDCFSGKYTFLMRSYLRMDKE